MPATRSPGCETCYGPSSIPGSSRSTGKCDDTFSTCRTEATRAEYAKTDTLRNVSPQRTSKGNLMTHRFCDGISRRDLVKVGVLGAAGLNLARYLQLTNAGEVRPARARAAIFVFLGGGPAHHDTFDPKPDAPDGIRGEFRPIATNVTGL